MTLPFKLKLTISDWIKVAGATIFVLTWVVHAIITANEYATEANWVDKQVHELRYRVWVLEHPEDPEAKDYIHDHPEIYKKSHN